ncbi:MAG: hypothetical protein KDE56_19315 [Anaerolineales bacterium]|nr:hypothetical protein [Anaerolineales bacterium]
MTQLLSRYYFWFFVPIAIGAFIWFFLVSNGQREDLGLVITIIGSSLSFFYVVQKQKLEELQTFKQLFTDFNKRYDSMNEKLNEIVKAETLKDCHHDILNDYFNLCSEEYLYYRKGHVYGEVWKAWCNGMLYYLADDKISQKWKDEQNQNSYYGLTLEEIKRGSRKRTFS